MRAYALVGLAASAWLAGGAALAQPAPSETDAETEAMSPVVVTGAPTPGTPLRQSSQIDVMQAPEKDEVEGTSLGETLDGFAGVNNISTGNNVGKPVIRGLSGLRVRVMTDGIGLDHQQYGVRHPPNIDPFLSERIDVVRGAQSVLYGSDALGGVINVRPYALPYGESLGGDTLLRYASNNGQFDSGLRIGGGSENWALQGALVRRDAGNIEVPDEPTFFPPPPDDPAKRSAPAYSGELDFTDFEQLNGTLATGFRNEAGEWALRYTRWDNEQNFLLPPPAGMKPPPEGEEGIGQFLEDEQLRLDGRFEAAGMSWKPTVAWQNNVRQSNAAGNDLSVPFDGTIDIEFDQYTARLEAVHGPALGLDGGTFGVEYMRKDQASRGRVQLTPGGDVENLGVFAFEERAFGPLLLQAGLRFDHRETVARESETASDETNFDGVSRNSYSVVTGSLGGSFALTDTLTLASNIGRGFRAPTLFELHVNGTHGGVAAVQKGDPNLEEETSLSSDLSLRWVTQDTRVIASVYRNAIDGYIFPRDTGQSADNGLPIFQYDQDDAELIGAELAVRQQVTQWLALSATAETVEGEFTDSNDELPLLPADNVEVSARFTPAGTDLLREPFAELGVRYAASKDAAPGEPFSQFDGAPFGSASTDSYALLDLSAGVSTPVFGKDARLSVAVRNLLDEDYRNFLDTYKGYALSPGRDVVVTARVPF
ncbi:TonB-dependent receptor [Algiphilus sp.]|uniref:TonB-dependent receptor n=1 Tax=Algiphilus sp. TaxID=1872431 RepID=UPI0032EDA194